MLTIHAPELRAEGHRNLIRTASGVVIGGAYVRPAPRQSEDAERMQRVLLGRVIPTRPTFWQRLRGWLLGR